MHLSREMRRFEVEDLSSRRGDRDRYVMNQNTSLTRRLTRMSIVASFVWLVFLVVWNLESLWTAQDFVRYIEEEVDDPTAFNAFIASAGRPSRFLDQTYMGPRSAPSVTSVDQRAIGRNIFYILLVHIAIVYVTRRVGAYRIWHALAFTGVIAICSGFALSVSRSTGTPASRWLMPALYFSPVLIALFVFLVRAAKAIQSATFSPHPN